MQVASIFRDNMVLQANKPVPIHGTGDGEAIVEIYGQRFCASSKDSKWMTILSPMPYGGPYTMTLILNGEKSTINNVMLGEVLLVAGQSNVQFTVGEEEPRETFFTNDALRFYYAPRLEAYDGQKTEDGWTLLNPATAPSWSAIGYHVALSIHAQLGLAVGIVGCYQGASYIQSWIDEKIISREEFYVPPEQMRYARVRAPHCHEWNQFGRLFEKAFKQVAPYAYTHVIWYQGEINTSIAEGKLYLNMLKALIENWRAELLDETLPFVVVQICDYVKRNDEGWRLIQKAQADAETVIPYVKSITSRDVCDSTSIHPPDKRVLSKKIFKAMYGI